MATESFCSFSMISVAIAVAVVVLSAVYYFFKNRDLPPGPVGLPFIGYWPFLHDKTCGEQTEKLKQKYGDVFSFTCAGRLHVHLGTIKAVREAHVAKAEAFGGRYMDFNIQGYFFKNAVAFVNGESSRVLRKFFLQALKDRGMMSIRDSTSGFMYQSINGLVEDLLKKNGEPVNLFKMVTEKCGRIFHNMLFGEEGMSVQEVLDISELYLGVMTAITPTNLLLTGNFGRYFIFPFMPTVQVGIKNHKKASSILFRVVNEHKSTYNEDHIRDVIDDFIRERDMRRKKGDSTACHFTDEAIVSTLEQIIGDGVIAASAFVCVVFKSLLSHPQEQKKVYEEIMEVVGADRQPCIEDKNKFTYTNAYILESLRMAEFFPFAPSLECTKETTLRGYRIPKGAITVVNTHTAHFDPEEFEEPRKFNPSRYISTECQKRPELPVTFGVGKRSCIGESFSMMQAFLFLTTIIKNINLTLTENATNSLDVFDDKIKVIARPRI